MKLLPNPTRAAHTHGRRGAALLLSLLILLILVAIVIQINISTGTDARIGRNDVTISTMDFAAESALLQCAESLKADSDADASANTAGAPGGPAGAGLPTGAAGAAGAAGGAPQEQSTPCDSRRDEWASPQRTEINQIQLRIITQDENSKYNVLNMLVPDEKEAQAAYDRVVRILDACREGTQYDIDPRTAEEMASTMRDHMLKRPRSKLPRPKLLTDDEKNEDLGMPTSMREFLPLEPFEELHFRDFRDQDNRVVHSITTFLTVWSSLSTNPRPPPVTASSGGASTKGSAGSSSSGSSSKSGSGSTSSNGRSGSSSSTSGSTTGGGKSGSSTSQTTGSGTSGSAQQGGTGGTGGTNDPNAANNQAGGNAGASSASKSTSTSGGFSVNVNTAPAAVLKSLFDSREVAGRFWDKVIEYRNLEDQEEKEKAKEAEAAGGEEKEEQLDEYGQPVLIRQIFKSVQDLSKVDGWGDLPAETQTKVTQILTVQSEVFSVFVIARKTTAAEEGAALGLTPAESRKREETRGDALQRVVHAVLWRQKGAEETKIVPVVRWEILDYLPYEVLDFPPEDR